MVNYARHLAGREEALRRVLIDYFPDDWLLIVDEPRRLLAAAGDVQRRSGPQEGVDRAWLPCPLPLITGRSRVKSSGTRPTRRCSSRLPRATGRWSERRWGGRTGDPPYRCWIGGGGAPTSGRVDDLLGEIRDRAAKNQQVLVTTLTKRMAEDLTDYLAENEVRVRYHSKIHSIERIEIIQDLRLGEYDVLVDFLQEGLDLPEVSLVAILDADDFLRAERSLIQTIGRAARHVEGVALLYADNMTDSMAKAISETEQRRAIQQIYNEKRRGANGSGQEGQQLILSFLELSRKLKQDDSDVDLVEVVGKAAKPLEDEPDAGLALEHCRVDRPARSQDEGGREARL